MKCREWVCIDKDVEHELLEEECNNFKWSLVLDAAIERVRQYKQDYLLSKYGVPEPSQRWPPTRKRKEVKR